MNCPICGSPPKNEKLFTTCAFTKSVLERSECTGCGLIFGPEYMIFATPDRVKSEYERLYANYDEGDTTCYNIQTFNDIKPSKEGIYLDYGCGRWSKSIKILVEDGYRVYGYEPYVLSDNNLILNDLSGCKFDGLFSHNVIEHFQDPIVAFENFYNLLRPDGIMAHSTPCYNYKYIESQFHIYFYTGKSVENLCSRTGFKLLEWKDYDDYRCCIFKKL